MSESDAGVLLDAIAKKRAKETPKSSSVNDEVVLPANHAANSQNGADKKKGRRKGKRSDPNYKQTGVYLPTDLTHRVKKRLYDHDMDFSDLIAELLTQWETKESAKDN